MKKSPLRIAALGGLGEIGLNLMVMECGDNILLIDCGVLFPDLYWMGLDLVLPDFSYLVANQDRIKGLVITHGHEDHIGAIPFLLKKVKVPIIYCSRFASRLIIDKSAEHGIKKELLTYTVQAGDAVDVGSFNVEFIHVTHSTLETFALAIRTPHGLVVHSGDFKFDETPYSGPASDKKRFKELGKEDPLLLLSDSTNSERCGHSKSESSISEELDRLVKESPAAVVVALFASNIHRVHQLIDIATKYGRKVFLSGRSMERYVQIAIEENFLPVKLSALRPIEEIGQYPRDEVLVLSTGSQGEARSSLLRLAKNENRWLKLQPKDVVILSSRNIPGNEKAISFVVNQLFKLGVTVHYEDMKNVHVSGHAYQSEQIELIKLVKPRYFIPVHGEYRHLVLHAETAKKNGVEESDVYVIENGHVWEFDGKRARVLEESIPNGRRWVFRDQTGRMDDEEILDRRVAARGGVVVVTCTTLRRGAELQKPPEIILKGFLCTPEKQIELAESIIRFTGEAFETWFAENPEGLTREQAVGAAARRAVKKALDVKPLVIVKFVNQ
jgi:ribonuclease J